MDDFPKGIVAAGACIHYLIETQHDKINHIASLSRIDQGQFVWLDRFTIRNLELLHSPNANAKTLIDIIDKTVSPMGSRLMRRWIALPLKNKEQIEARYAVVEHFTQHHEAIGLFQDAFRAINDLERLISKVSLSKVNPRELLQVGRALDQIETLKSLCSESQHEALKSYAEQLDPCVSIRERIKTTLNPEAPALLSKGNFIANGVDAELDEL